MSQTNKEMRSICIDNSKRVLGCLLNSYPMISFHQNSQVNSIITHLNKETCSRRR